MKLENHDGDIFDLTEAELQLLKREQEKFWQSIQELVRYGVPAYDKKGHWTEVRVRVRPMQIDMVGAVREKMPDGWFKSQASLYRSIIAVGCKTMLKFLAMEKTQWDEILMGLNKIAKKQRLDEFKEEMSILKNDIANGNMDPSEKVKVIDIVSRLERKVMQM
jgi:hypothetical protein